MTFLFPLFKIAYEEETWIAFASFMSGYLVYPRGIENITKIIHTNKKL